MNKGTQFVINACYLLKGRGITLKEFEKNAGVSPGYLSRCKSDNKKISLDLAMKIADGLGMSVDEIIAVDAKALRIAQLEAELKELKGENDEFKQIK